jgi:hypothetical protein
VFDARSAILLSLITVGAVACSSPPEEAVLGQFFAAARLRDNTALASFATVRFEPHIDGIVTAFDVTHVTAEIRTSFTRRAVGEAREEAKTNDLILQLSMSIRPDVDITKYEGQVGSKDLTIEAPVKLPDGRIVQRTLIVTMQRVVLKADREMIGRWIVTGLRVSSDRQKPQPKS